MKRAVSISIGSSTRNKRVEAELMGQRVVLERMGTDGDMKEAARLFTELDGTVDAFGLGGALLGFLVGGRWFKMHTTQALVRGVRRTPLVDGTGLKRSLEYRAAQELEATVGPELETRKVLVISGVDRFGLLRGFLDAGYACVIGDLMFALGLPIPLHSERGVHRMAKLVLPVVGRMPFRWLYPTGKSQELHTPKWGRYFEDCSVIAGDCHYITRYMPADLRGKIVVTNTTTAEDRDRFRRAGVTHLLTTTPVYGGRSFGTNVLEAAMLAVCGYRGRVDYERPGDYFTMIEQMVDELELTPTVQEL